jgi:branched-chain amino acid transport system substrate-binding protein
MKPLISLASLVVALGCSGAQAQYTDGTIRIGVLNDMSGTYSDLSGRGSLIATRMAVEDFGAAAKGMKVEIVGAGHQNKSNVGSTAVRPVVSSPQLRVRLAAVISSSALL